MDPQEDRSIDQNATPDPTPINTPNSSNKSQPQPDSINMLPVQPSKRRKKVVLIVVLFLVALAATTAFILARDSSKPSAVTTSTKTAPHLVLFNDATGILTLTDSTGKTAYTSTLPRAARFVASSPNGKLLLSSYDTNTKITRLTLLGSDGSNLTINSAVDKQITDSFGAYSPIIFLNENEVAFSYCVAIQSSTNNDCKVVRANLSDGSQKTLYQATVPAYATGDSLYYLVGISLDKQTLYLETPVVGASSSPIPIAVESIDINTATAKQLYAAPTDRYINNLLMSPDAKKIIYDTSDLTASTSKIYIVDLASGKEVNISWGKTMPGNGWPYVWSPDNKKVTFVGNTYVNAAGPGSSTGPLGASYINTTSNTLTDLQTIDDAAHNTIRDLLWLDDTTLAYGLNTSTKDNDFSNATTAIYQQAISTKKITQMTVSAGRLLSVVWF